MKRLFQYSILLLFLSMLLSCGTSKSLNHKPQLVGYNNAIPVVKKQSNTLFSTGNNFLLKNKQNLWELYVEGDALERGLLTGSLTDSLLNKQQHIFFDKIKELLPSKFKQNVLRNFLKWYGRKLYLNIPDEYKPRYTEFRNILPMI